MDLESFSDSRTNPFKEGEDEKNHGVPNGPIAKKIQKTFEEEEDE